MKHLIVSFLAVILLFPASSAFCADHAPDSQAVLTIYITRHAQRADRKFWPKADRNAVTRGEMIEGKLERPEEHSITPTGERQCRALGEYLKKLGFRGKVIASPVFRTMQTAVITAESCDPSLKVQPEPKLQTVGRGAAPRRGMSCSELEKRFPGKVIHTEYPEFWLLPKETEKMRAERLTSVLDGLIRGGERGGVLLVTHSSAIPFLVAALNRYAGSKTAALEYSHRDDCLNCCLLIFRFNEKGKLVSSSADTRNYLVPELRTSNLTQRK